MMAINTVAAGGGSILHFDGARFRVGPGLRRRRSRARLLPPRRPADRDRRQCLRRQDPAAAFPGDLRPERRPAARCGGGDGEIRRARGRDRARHRRSTRRRGRSRRAFCRSPSPTWRMRSSRSRCRRATTPPASRCNASAAPAASTPAWWPTSSAWRRCSSTPCRRAVRLWHGAGRPDGHARAGGGDAARRGGAWPSCCEARRRWRRGRARRSRGREPSRRASRAAHLHLRYAGTDAALIVPFGAHRRDRAGVHRGASRPLRLRHAGAAAGGRGASRSRRPAPATRCARRSARLAPAARPEPIDHGADFRRRRRA